VLPLGQEIWPAPGPRRPVKWSKRRSTSYDLKELDAGCEVELEHTKDRTRACKIALDHLREDPHYYTKLCSIWPKERGCQHVRRPFQAVPWPWLFLFAGIGIAGAALWSSQKRA
jgi:hypothetical protein